MTKAYLNACADPESPLRTAGSELDLEPTFARVYGQRQLSRPLFVAEGELRQVAADVQALHELLFSLPDRLYGGDVARLCVDLGMSQRATALACAAAAQGRTPLYGRPDLYHDGESFKLLELNTGSELGGVDWAAVNQGYLKLSEFRAFAREQDLSYVDTGEEIARYLRRLAAPVTGGADPVVALVDISTNMATYLDNYVSFVEHMAPHGIDIRICHISELGSQDGKLTVDGTPVDVAMRYFTLEEICADPRAEEWLAPVLRAHQAGRTIFFASLDYGIYANKGILALVSELRQQGGLSPDEAAMVDRILPWTRRVTPAIWEHCRDNRERLVLKPAVGASGAGVTIGWDVTPDEWAAAFEKASTTPYIVQERVAPAPEPVPDGDTLVDWLPAWGVFVFEQGYAGNFIRALPADAGTVINEATGSAFTCVFSYPGE
ncbi:hypothetical protein GCM10027280_17880 [Micromonospora polyrhachis]|uniref:Glutathionylspermidine synthase n=1 Tax=Micromonospora polyrhachis TaxID=1282883 RepID=A0A7W7WMJ7_9ACTN|nr:glutathionylspermidine synthase family protein [Micromonospora polyrhachis]MBB4956885.1 glutathionylspermidine synthase [Micromonospora polyrhachis]